MIGANNTISVQRLTTDSFNKDSYATAFVTDLSAYIEPMNPELAPMYSGQGAYQMFKIFSDYADIRIKDRITDAQGNQYAVEGVAVHTNNEIPTSVEIVCNKKFV